MSDRITALIVVFDQDMHGDTAKDIANAIRHMRYVVDVSPVVADATYYVTKAQVRAELEQKLWDALRKS